MGKVDQEECGWRAETCKLDKRDERFWQKINPGMRVRTAILLGKGSVAFGCEVGRQ